MRSTRRCTEWRPRHAFWRFGSNRGPAIGELIVRHDYASMISWDSKQVAQFLRTEPVVEESKFNGTQFTFDAKEDTV